MLDNFNLVVNKGEMMAITGQSGTGKSTLLKYSRSFRRTRLWRCNHTRNRKCLEEREKANRAFRYTIGYLFQNYALIDNETVSKNLDVALEYVKLSNKDDKKKKF